MAYKGESKEHPDWLVSAAKTLYDELEKECQEKRRWMLPFWKRAEYYWNDIQDLYFDPQYGDYLPTKPSTNASELEAILEANKIVQVYRPYGESIIAAATIGNLAMRFYPGDADIPADIDKAQSFTDKAEYVQRMNSIRNLRRRAFYIRWTQGLVGSYVYYKTDADKYGTIKKDILGDRERTTVTRTCADPECKERLDQKEFVDQPEELAADLSSFESSNAICPACGGDEFETEDLVDTTPMKIGEEEIDKGCSQIDLFAPMDMIVPFWAKTPRDVPYVIIKSEINYSTARSLYPKYADKINPGNSDKEEAEDRAQSDAYRAEPSQQLVTVTKFFCKPSQYYILFKGQEGSDHFNQLKNKYRKGLFATYVGDCLVDCQDMNMDEHWTFLESPLDSHIYCRALGNATIPIQDMENDLAYLTMDTIKHAIGETFYDQRILNAEAYQRAMAKAGNMVPIGNPMPSKNIGEYFFSTKQASLSQEVDRFSERLEAKGQLASGAFPSVFGGQFSEGSKTLGVYQESRNAALQRTSMPANDIDEFLAQTIFKATELYDKNMSGDEKYSVTEGNGYKNLNLRKSAPGAKVGRAELMKSEQFPVTFEQQRAFVMELFGLNIDPINAALLSVENLPLMDRVMSIEGLTIPGIKDRNKQLSQIQELLLSGPEIDPMSKIPMPTVLPDKDVDNHNVCISTIINWAVSPEGIRTKRDNPEGYANVMAQLNLRKMLVAPTPMPAEEGAEEDKPNEGGNEPPAEGEAE